MIVLDNALTVDPGKNTGWCYWVDGEIVDKDLFKTNKSDDVFIVADLSEKFEILLNEVETKIEKVIIESVGMWSNSVASVASASRGNTFTVAYIAGAYMNICLDYGIEVELIDPRKWKGNMKKHQTSNRVTRALGHAIENEHVCDAVAIGLSVQGKL